MAFYVLGVPGFLWALGWLIWFRDYPENKVIDEAEASTPTPLLQALRSWGMAKAMAQYFIGNFTFFICITWMFPYLAERYSLTPSQAARFSMDHWKYPLSSSDPAVVEKSLAGMHTSLHNAKLWGSDAVLLVPAVVNAQTSYREAWTRSQEQTRKLIPMLHSSLAGASLTHASWPIRQRSSASSTPFGVSPQTKSTGFSVALKACPTRTKCSLGVNIRVLSHTSIRGNFEFSWIRQFAMILVTPFPLAAVSQWLHSRGHTPFDVMRIDASQSGVKS